MLLANVRRIVGRRIEVGQVGGVEHLTRDGIRRGKLGIDLLQAGHGCALFRRRISEHLDGQRRAAPGQPGEVARQQRRLVLCAPAIDEDVAILIAGNRHVNLGVAADLLAGMLRRCGRIGLVQQRIDRFRTVFGSQAIQLLRVKIIIHCGACRVKALELGFEIVGHRRYSLPGSRDWMVRHALMVGTRRRAYWPWRGAGFFGRVWPDRDQSWHLPSNGVSARRSRTSVAPCGIWPGKQGAWQAESPDYRYGCPACYGCGSPPGG